jgi:hypothetical protein
LQGFDLILPSATSGDELFQMAYSVVEAVAIEGATCSGGESAHDSSCQDAAGTQSWRRTIVKIGQQAACCHSTAKETATAKQNVA